MEGYKRTLNGLNQSIDASTITFEDDEFSASSFLKTNSNKEIYTVMKVGGADINTADDYTVENLSVANNLTKSFYVRSRKRHRTIPLKNFMENYRLSVFKKNHL